MCNVLGVGLDLCAVDRMEAQLDGRLMARCFTEAEAAYIHSRGAQAAQSMAGLWAAKEAVAKALGTGVAFSMRDIEVRHTALGQPVVHLHGQAVEAARDGSFLLSITHEGGMAAAVAVWTAPPHPQSD